MVCLSFEGPSRDPRDHAALADHSNPEKVRRLPLHSGSWGSVRAACEAARISKYAAFDWRGDDSDFATACDAAIEAGIV
jgi:hypothetical protein